MKRNNKYLDKTFDRIAEEIRDETLDASAVTSAAERVLASLSSEATSARAAHQERNPVVHIRGCDDFQSLIPAYLSGSLTEARTLLLEDHTHECIPCRKALKEARTGLTTARPTDAFDEKPVRSLPKRAKWAIAAAVIIGLAVLSVTSIDRFSNTNKAFRAIVSAMNGEAYVVADTENRPIKAGEDFKLGEKIRTAKDAGAVVKLPDGSLIEMKERSEFSVSENSEGVTIDLERGNVIVQAAKQRSRHLYVSTNDCLVSVKGTIFSVNNGTKGSRVSVIEGEVHVDHAGEKHVLHAGEQVTTSESIEKIPVKDEIAWSRDAETYRNLLVEFEALRKELNERVSLPEVRYSTNLLDLVPEDTVLYVAIPNLSATLKESYQIIEQRMQENETLREWWESERASSRSGPGLDRIINKISEFGEYLGPEIVAAAEIDGRGEPGDPVLLAELNDAVGFRAYLDRQIAEFNAGSSKKLSIRIIDDPTRASDDGSQAAEVFVAIRDNILAVSPKPKSLERAAARLKTGNASRFAQSSFRDQIAELYTEGAGLIVAADLEKILSQSIEDGAKSGGRSKDAQMLRQLGLLNLKHFIVEMKEKDGKPQNRAVLSFDGSQRGVTTWLAEPGPMGALEFISPDANIVAAFVVREPVALVDDLLGAIETVEPDVHQIIKGFEQESGLEIRNDFAAPLGGEFAFAIDGPLLPTPSWKLVFEVNDPAHLQNTIERVVDRLNAYARMRGKAGLDWEQADIGGRTFYTLKSAELGIELNYTYANGYLVAAPSRALVDRAVRYRESGYTLLHSPRFTASLPEDRNANFSAFIYQNLTSVVAPLAGRLSKAAGNLSEEEQQAVRSLAAATPTLAYAYAYQDRIIFSLNTEEGPLSLKPGSLLGLPGPFGLKQIMKESLR
ncbi:MAG: FecR domain-containing protein [Blastocatellia bacterium]|nr:FecR domain-containing protein [Blastocatellia bacterium]